MSRSSSKRRMMWRQYVTSSASTRRSDGCTLFRARWNSSSETPRRAGHPPAFEHREREASLSIAWEAAVQARVVDRASGVDCLDQRHERRLQLVEDRLDLRRLHPRLVVVEENVVGVFLRLE